MGLMDITAFNGGLELLGFGKQGKVKQSNRVFAYEEGFVKSSDVYAITSKIAKSGKSVEWILEVEKNGKIEEVTSGELYDITQNPNTQQTRAEFTEYGLLNLLLSGEVFGRTKKLIGIDEAQTISFMNPQLTIVNVEKILREYYIESYKYDGNPNPISKEEVTFIKYTNPTVEGTKTLRGLSPLIAGALTVKGINNNQEANVTILENQGASGILSNEGDRALTGEEAKVEQSRLDKLLAGVRNFGKIIQAASKVKFTRLGLDPTQLKIIESKIMMFRDLCAIYDVDPKLFGDPKSSAFNNVTNAEKSFWINAVIPNTQLILDLFYDAVVEDYNKKDFPNGNGKYILRLAVEKIAPLQADKLKEAQKDKLKMDGVSILLQMPISFEGKVELLVSEYGYTEETAKIIAKPIKVEDNGGTD